MVPICNNLSHDGAVPDDVYKLIGELNPRQFENLTYECLRALGMKNILWRTPGSDGGRDIEGSVFVTDIAGYEQGESWFVDSKRYAKSIGWPIVWEKLAYAESGGADVLLISTTSNPSPQCENEIANWNKAHKRPKIRFWRGYDLSNIVRSVPHVGVMFGLLPANNDRDVSLLPLAQLVSKLAGSAYTRVYFSPSDLKPVETTAALSELFMERLRELREYGRPVAGEKVRNSFLFPWLTTSIDLAEWEETPLRAALSFLTYEFHASAAGLTADGDDLIVTLADTRPDCAGGLPADRGLVSFWSRLRFEPTALPISWRLRREEYA